MRPIKTAVVVISEGMTMLDIAYWPKKHGINIPSKGKGKILGYIWNPCLFGNRAPADLIALIVFVGGARQPELTGLKEAQIIQIMLDELKSIMQFSGKPVYLNVTSWQRSISQYEIGYEQKIDILAQFEKYL